MLCSFPRDTAEALLNSGLVEETECACNACLLGSTTEERLKRAAEHNLAMLKAQQLQLAGLSIRDRMAALRDGISRARAIRRRLHTFVPTFNDRMDHLAVLERCLDEVERTGLLEPGQAARRAG
jgi:hypothetical protein